MIFRNKYKYKFMVDTLFLQIKLNFTAVNIQNTKKAQQILIKILFT